MSRWKKFLPVDAHGFEEQPGVRRLHQVQPLSETLQNALVRRSTDVSDFDVCSKVKTTDRVDSRCSVQITNSV